MFKAALILGIECDSKSLEIATFIDKRDVFQDEYSFDGITVFFNSSEYFYLKEDMKY